MYVDKKNKLWKIEGSFWTWQKGVFVCFFSGFNVLVVCFCVFGKVATKVLKMRVFSVLGAFGGRLLLYYSRLEGLGVFVFLVFLFFVCWFCFCFLLCFVLLLDCFWCRSCFCFWGFVSCFVFWALFLLVIVCFVCLCWSDFVFCCF